MIQPKEDPMSLLAKLITAIVATVAFMVALALITPLMLLLVPQMLCRGLLREDSTGYR